MSATLSAVRRSIFPTADDTWTTIAARELKGKAEAEAVSLLQSWNMHVFMRAAAPKGSPREGRQILPSDVIFVEAPRA